VDGRGPFRCPERIWNFLFCRIRQKYKGFSKFIDANVPNTLFNYLILKNFIGQIKTTGCKEVVSMLL
jgi:hypothetical protein